MYLYIFTQVPFNLPPLVSVLSLLITWQICPTWEVKPQTLYDFSLHHRRQKLKVKPVRKPVCS